MALISAALWVLGVTLGRLGWWLAGEPGALDLNAVDAIASSAVLISIGVFLYTRQRDRDPHHILNLGLAYMVFTALDLGLIGHWYPPDRSLQATISWSGTVVVTYAAIVPTPPRKILIAGLIAASMHPLAMLIARARGTWDFGPTTNVLLMHYPDYLLVGVAVVISRVVTGLGQQVTKAREMGSYQLGELLGRGGMGEVYLARHRMLARPAAIKLINPDSLGGNGEAADVAVKRFRREAETAANLRSPHTVELYDFGVTEDQTMYFVMELLEGMNLESLVRQYGPLAARRVIHILRQVCESLEEAHVAGMVHRDIKPANIHLGRLGLRHDFVKVLDFGLVKPITGRAEEHSLATATGMTPGTPAYMAPEIAMGETVDGRADIYALGCVAYYLLTGKLVFDGATEFQVMVKHLRSEPVPPSERVTFPIPADLERLVLGCLAKKPSDRPAGAGALAKALAAIDVEPWTEEDAREWWSANRPREVKAV